MQSIYSFCGTATSIIRIIAASETKEYSRKFSSNPKATQQFFYENICIVRIESHLNFIPTNLLLKSLLVFLYLKYFVMCGSDLQKQWFLDDLKNSSLDLSKKNQLLPLFSILEIVKVTRRKVRCWIVIIEA